MTLRVEKKTISIERLTLPDHLCSVHDEHPEANVSV